MLEYLLCVPGLLSRATTPFALWFTSTPLSPTFWLMMPRLRTKLNLLQRSSTLIFYSVFADLCAALPTA